MKTLLINIQQLVQTRSGETPAVKGKDLNILPSINNAFVELVDGKIVRFGTMADLEPQDLTALAYIHDCTGQVVMPTFCDSHTHLVFAGTRENEFVDRIKGKTYEEIAANGGGILNSAKKLAETPEEDLFESAWDRLMEVIGTGTGAIEIKSGYGLSLDAELKMLRVIRELKRYSPIPIKATFLGAHAIPAAYKSNRDAYVDLIVDQMIPQLVAEELADYVDVFCDRGFFTVPETDRILAAGAKYGLKAKIHANELDYSGGIQVGVAHRAVSVDHLECTGEEEIAALLKSNTMPTLLPSTAFFLNLHYPPARKMIDAGLPVSLATDYNPGSSPSGNFPFVLSLACTQMKMTPEEAINAATINAAHAMELNNLMGSICVGKKANLLLTTPMESYNALPYSFGGNRIESVILDGDFFQPHQP